MNNGKMYVFKVHYDINHERIEEVVMGPSIEYKMVSSFSKKSIIMFIENNYFDIYSAYKSNGKYVEGEKINIVSHRFLRTDPNNTEKDNLGKIEEY